MSLHCRRPCVPLGMPCHVMLDSAYLLSYMPTNETPTPTKTLTLTNPLTPHGEVCLSSCGGAAPSQALRPRCPKQCAQWPMVEPHRSWAACRWRSARSAHRRQATTLNINSRPMLLCDLRSACRPPSPLCTRRGKWLALPGLWPYRLF